MKNKVSLLALVSVILLSGCGQSKKSEPLSAGEGRGTTQKANTWRTFSSPEGRFSVLMPGTPLAHKQNVQTPVGALALNIFLVERGNKSYGVSYSDYPKDLVENGSSDSILSGAQAGSVANVKGRVVAEKKIALGQHPGREYQLSTPQGGYRARIYLVGERLYQNIVMGPVTPSEDADKFFDSFQLVNE